MFKKNNDKVTHQEMNNRFDSLRNWELRAIEDAIQRLTQITSMLASKIGYDIHAVSGGPVKLIKIKNK